MTIRKRIYGLLAGTGALGLAAVAVASAGPGGDAERGLAQFNGQCALCHSNDPAGGASRGPPLYGVVGRKAGSAPGYGYSAALKETGWIWDDAALDKFLASPNEAVPGTTMPIAVFDAEQRADLIAYLHTLHGVHGALSPDRDGSDGRDSARLIKVAAIRDGQDGSDAKTPSSPAPAAVYGDWRDDSPGKVHRITVADLPPPFATKSAGNPSHRAERPAGALPQVPPGVKVALYAEGLRNPRRMIVAPNGDVFLAETGAGRVRVLRPSADGAKPAASSAFVEDLKGPFGMALYPAGPNPEWLYVAEENRVLRFPYRVGDQAARGKPEVIVAKLKDTSGGHSTRDLAFSPDGKRLFISVGSQSNYAEQIAKRPVAEAVAFDQERGAIGATWGAEENRADVLETTPTGGPLKLFATGIRNCVGLTVQPANGALWCAVNERDGLGDDLVPDYVTRVKAGGFYGWPWWYIGDHEEPRLKGERPDLQGKVSVPDVLIQPHSAALQIAFYQGSMFPQWRGSGLVTLHGSWNREKRTGYKLVRILTDKSGAPTGAYEDVMTGLVADDAGVWGRPVGVAVAKDGSILVSDDGGGVIWRLSR